MTDFYKRVPLTLKENLLYRRKLLLRAETDLEFRNALIGACAHDPAFFMATMCWIFEPRPREVNGVALPTKIPFIPWPHQLPAILEIDKHLGKEDIAMEKARGEGASWMGVFFAVKDFLFKPMASVGVVSKDENSVDTPDNTDSIFWKIDWELSCLPPWMMRSKPKRNLTYHTILNPDNGANISGFACTGNVASGGRKTWFFIDELSKFPHGPDADSMASTQHVTDSRLIVATPFGTSGEYYRIMHEPSSMVKIILDWKDNPTKNRGLYRLTNGVPVAVDKENNPLPSNYDPPDKLVSALLSRLRRKGFKLDGTIRSPWYDHECDRPSATPQSIAQELDRDYGGSMARYFGTEFFEEAKKTFKKPKRFTIDYSQEELKNCSLSKNDLGPVEVYCALDAKNRPAEKAYVAGADVSAGIGGVASSNSVLQVIDAQTGEQVLEYTTNTTAPADFADDCIAICKIFNDAYLIWEINGPGSGFTMQVMDRQYPNIYMRKVLWKKGKGKRMKEPGWHTGQKTKELMFSELHRRVKVGEAVIRSEKLLQECSEYIRDGNKIEHVGASRTEDGASKGEAHGDRVMAFAIAIQGIKDRPFSSKSKERQEEKDAPPWTMAGRNKYWEDRNAREMDWDDREGMDMARSWKETGYGTFQDD